MQSTRITHFVESFFSLFLLCYSFFFLNFIRLLMHRIERQHSKKESNSFTSLNSFPLRWPTTPASSTSATWCCPSWASSRLHARRRTGAMSRTRTLLRWRRTMLMARFIQVSGLVVFCIYFLFCVCVCVRVCVDGKIRPRQCYFTFRFWFVVCGVCVCVCVDVCVDDKIHPGQWSYVVLLIFFFFCFFDCVCERRLVF